MWGYVLAHHQKPKNKVNAADMGQLWNVKENKWKYISVELLTVKVKLRGLSYCLECLDGGYAG